ncbi:phosphoribosylaminoimidazolesuccinocarboxamide synthase, partial [Cobetia marina]
MEKREELYAGKAKSVFVTDDPDLLLLEFRDDTSAFDGGHGIEYVIRTRST